MSFHFYQFEYIQQQVTEPLSNSGSNISFSLRQLMVDSSGLVQQLDSVIKNLGPFPSVILSILCMSCLMATR